MVRLETELWILLILVPYWYWRLRLVDSIERVYTQVKQFVVVLALYTHYGTYCYRPFLNLILPLEIRLCVCTLSWKAVIRKSCGKRMIDIIEGQRIVFNPLYPMYENFSNCYFRNFPRTWRVL